jgi:hypothetical protein
VPGKNGQDEVAFAIDVTIHVAGELFRKLFLESRIRGDVNGMAAKMVAEPKMIAKRQAVPRADVEIVIRRIA